MLSKLLGLWTGEWEWGICEIVVGWQQKNERFGSRMALGFRVDRGVSGRVDLHGFRKTDEATALETG